MPEFPHPIHEMAEAVAHCADVALEIVQQSIIIVAIVAVATVINTGIKVYGRVYAKKGY